MEALANKPMFRSKRRPGRPNSNNVRFVPEACQYARSDTSVVIRHHPWPEQGDSLLRCLPWADVKGVWPRRTALRTDVWELAL